jgi:hypothetical protein
MGIPLIDNLLGFGGKVLDKVLPDKDAVAQQTHERNLAQIEATKASEEQRNYFTPRSILLYSMSFAVVYGVVVQPFLKAFGLELPEVDISVPLRLLLGMFGLDWL